MTSVSTQQFIQRMLDAKTHVVPTGARTKSALAACDAAVQQFDMRGLHGILVYDASEFLITALAGTTVAELQAALGEKGQYLPFDPMFVDQGATLGGTVASGLSGANRLLYGGLRDFVMEVELIDGLGRLVRGGGKVVKNAAGFDLPKLVVGSYGRLGILTELTLKVFPKPQASATLVVDVATPESCIAMVQRMLAQPLPIAALDIDVLTENIHDHQPVRETNAAVECRILVRFAGPTESLPFVLSRAAAFMPVPCRAVLDADEDSQLWAKHALLVQRLSSGLGLVRVATTLESLRTLPAALKQLPEISLRYQAGGAVAWLSVPDQASVLESLDTVLAQQQLAGVMVCGNQPSLRALGDNRWLAMARRIQAAIDPQDKFVRF